MKKTAVEWLNEQMNNIKGSSISMNGSVQFIEKELNNLLEQAKAMEKEQMNKNTNFICHGCGTKHTGENDDQIYEVCKQCFINL